MYILEKAPLWRRLSLFFFLTLAAGSTSKLIGKQDRAPAIFQMPLSLCLFMCFGFTLLADFTFELIEKHGGTPTNVQTSVPSCLFT